MKRIERRRWCTPVFNKRAAALHVSEIIGSLTPRTCIAGDISQSAGTTGRHNSLALPDLALRAWSAALVLCT